MITTPAGLNHYNRTITTKRADRCQFCEEATVAGRDFASVDAEGKWHATCATCAASYQAQAAVLIKSIERHVGTVQIQIDAAALDLPDPDALTAVLAGTADRTDSFTMTLRLLQVRRQVLAILTPAPEAPAWIDGLRAIAADPISRDRSFAASLVQQFDRKGSLSPKQVACAERMVATLATPAAAPAGPLDNGLYVNDDGRVYKLYTTQNDRQGCKILDVSHGSGSFSYLQGGVARVRDQVAAGTAHVLTEAEAQAFGKLHGFCVNCARDLDDDRSLAVGYGPVCARNLGWFYPSVSEAADMLQRPASTTWTCERGVPHQSGDQCVCGD